jgi:hypothetical protein
MCNILNQQLNELVGEIESKHLNDPSKMELLEKMAVLMMDDEQTTINFFENCNANHARIIYWISPFFDDIGDKFPSDKMVNAMISLIEKYPEDLDLRSDIQLATDLIHTIQNY